MVDFDYELSRGALWLKMAMESRELEERSTLVEIDQGSGGDHFQLVENAKGFEE